MNCDCPPTRHGLHAHYADDLTYGCTIPASLAVSRLTEKQRRALITAYMLGYYDILKKIGLVQLAEKLDLAYPAFEAHLRKAEKQLLSYIMNEA